MLGLGRALGETMAVAMVLSATGTVTFQLFTSTNPSTIAANIALTFPEAFGIDINVLIATGLILFVVTFAVNVDRPLDRQPPQGILGSQLMTITATRTSSAARRRRRTRCTAGRLPAWAAWACSAASLAVDARGLR